MGKKQILRLKNKDGSITAWYLDSINIGDKGEESLVVLTPVDKTLPTVNGNIPQSLMVPVSMVNMLMDSDVMWLSWV